MNDRFKSEYRRPDVRILFRTTANITSLLEE